MLPRRSQRLSQAKVRKVEIVCLPTTTLPEPTTSSEKVQSRKGGKGLTRAYESNKIARGFSGVIGVDEAGRGPLCGPVVAAACLVPMDCYVEGIMDSKVLSEEDRELIYEQLTTNPRIKWAAVSLSHEVIDEVNILQATLRAMRESAQAVASKLEGSTWVAIDGNRMPSGLDTETSETIVKGDSKVFSIAAASIIAKVTRDREMVLHSKQYPMYGWLQNKGYPTKEHVAAIREHGPSPIHRMTFRPLKTWFPKSDEELNDRQ